MEAILHKEKFVPTVDEAIDILESVMVENFPLVDCPLKHRFTDGMYIREIFMPKGALVTSLIHKTNHPFVVLRGEYMVFSENDGEQLIKAPYIGITTPKTRRVLSIIKDTVLITFHPTNIKPKNDSAEAVEEASDLVIAKITEQHENILLGGVIKNNVLIKTLKN